MSEVDSAVKNAGMNCTDEEDPFFLYHLTREGATGNSRYTSFTSVFNETTELDKVCATTGTLYSLYYKKSPSAAPTAASTTSSIRNSIAASKNWLTMFVAVWLHCSMMYSLLL